METIIFEAVCSVCPDEDSIKVVLLNRSLMFVEEDKENPMHTSVVLDQDAVEKLRDELTKWLESMK